MFFSEYSLLNQAAVKFKKEFTVIIAIDEVGRGCVAGPVLTCASIWVRSQNDGGQTWISQVKDSKKLTAKKRLTCFNQVLAYFNYTITSVPFKDAKSIPRMNLLKPKSVLEFAACISPTTKLQDDKLLALKHKENNAQHFTCLGFCLGESNISEVEQFNIWNAVQIAAARALLGLKEHFLDELNISLPQIILLMDGNKPLSVPELFLNVVQATAIKGDDLFISVGLSSILAKVHRDLFMENQEEIYPHFGFAQHKGYGTALHLENIQKHGTCALHRLSFLKKYTTPEWNP